MSVPASLIPGVIFGKLARHADSRGSFAEAWRTSGMTPSGEFAGVQANLSSSEQGVLRGLHLHQRQSDRWVVLAGVAFVAVVDIRPILADGAARPIVQTATLSRDDTVEIPPLVGHGFLAVAPLQLLYIVTNEYDGTDELGTRWDDPDIGVEWPRLGAPGGGPILSDRDLANPSLRSLVGRLVNAL